MDFLDRLDELRRLDSLCDAKEGGLAVIYGRRRIGKSRLLVKWVNKHSGVYFVADQSAAALQRRYLATCLGGVLTGIDSVEYPTWRVLFDRIAQDSKSVGWRGPVVLDELPYLVLVSPELPSVLQQWLDGPAKKCGMAVAIAGSSQRMMQGLVLNHDAPLFGRAAELFEIGPLPPKFLDAPFSPWSPYHALELYAAWGGVPRYWELAQRLGGNVLDQITSLVLDPVGPLHREPDRLLLEELPPAVEMRPILDAIGGGAHRVSEIAGRVGRPATSLSRALERLVSMGLVRREIPFAASPKNGRKSLYKMADPFFRLWFRVVAPYRSQLAAGSAQTRRQLLEKHWPLLVAATWEDTCRSAVCSQRPKSGLGRLGPWGPAARWWNKNEPEWDIVAVSTKGDRLLLGEAKAHSRPMTKSAVEKEARALLAKPLPSISEIKLEVVRALFIPTIAKNAPRRHEGVVVVTGDDILA
ncbi:MAG: hypothetical protein A2289_14710 [Deltaproteobacteria bacterium RIFOXYA12_FULL_58_15]|nr:MAG: hypothetical protein A2289_14710 [Deltaproteobacteria bacterium RIFOXYA12_FULL_58_15]OGR07848.1 MAG: hypothetical protein A2341_07235 [Deltaproteobacteria bacterium RIFOXYB12_FULL_58_9]